MHATQLVPALAALWMLATGASAAPQTVLFEDDFEGGLAAWTLTSQWHLVHAAQACPGQAAPFPSGNQAARFGFAGSSSFCSFGSVTGRLATSAPIAIPANAQGARLRFASFEQTECGFGNCGWDERFVRVSTDGVQWTTVWEGAQEGLWIEKQVDLSGFAGQDLWIAFDFAPVDGWVNDFLGWLVDDVRVEVDLPGEPFVYCTAKLNTLGCEPLMFSTGSATLSGPDDLFASCTNLHNQTLAKFLWSLAPFSMPFDGGTLCVAPPAKRTSILSSGGSANPKKDCTGVYTWHFSHAYLLQNGVSAGDTVYVQTSARDYGSVNKHSISNAVALPILP